MPRSSPSAAAEPASYEQALAELEALVQAMEAGKMPLDQLLSSYKRGAELLQQCRARLQVVEDQVTVLFHIQLQELSEIYTLALMDQMDLQLALLVLQLITAAVVVAV